MRTFMILALASFATATPAFAQCAPGLEGRWLDEASSIVKGKPSQVTGFILRRQDDGFYLVTLYDRGASAVARGPFQGGATVLKTKRVLGYDDLTAMFAGTVVGPLAIGALANQHIAITRTYRLSEDANTVAIDGDTVYASVRPNGMLDNYELQPLSYKSLRAPYPKPCARESHEAGWAEFKARANAYRDLKDKPATADDVRQDGMLALDAISNKDFDTALNQFEAALAIDPMWASGHYNAAKVYAQELDYENAAWHMRAYLELTPPDDKDYQSSRDLLLLWQGKLKQQQAEAPQAGPDD